MGQNFQIDICNVVPPSQTLAEAQLKPHIMFSWLSTLSSIISTHDKKTSCERSCTHDSDHTIRNHSQSNILVENIRPQPFSSESTSEDKHHTGSSITYFNLHMVPGIPLPIVAESNAEVANLTAIKDSWNTGLQSDEVRMRWSQTVKCMLTTLVNYEEDVVLIDHATTFCKTNRQRWPWRRLLRRYRSFRRWLWRRSLDLQSNVYNLMGVAKPA